MAVGKEQVRSFLRKVKDKAVTSVNTKHTKLFEQAIDKYLGDGVNPPLKKGLQLWAAASEMIDDGCTIPLSSKFSPLNDTMKNIRHNIFYGNDYTGERRNRVVNDGAIQAEWELWMTEKRMVEKEYDRVFGLIDKAPNGSKSLAILKELGFDVSSLEAHIPPVSPVDKINKDALFVCGEKS